MALLVLLGFQTVSWAQGEWNMRHANPARTGQAVGDGDITRPARAWQVSIGSEAPSASVLVADVTNDGELEYLSLVADQVVARNFNHELVWDTPTLGVGAFVQVGDLDGDGAPEILLVGRLVVAISGQTGQVVWRRTPDNPNTLSHRSATVRAINLDDDPELEVIFGAGEKIFEMYDFSNGFDAAPVWTSTDAALPNNVVRPVIGDFDGDGEARELAIVNQTNCQIVFLSLTSGQTLRVTAPLTQGLYCYGLYQAIDVDADPQDELLFTGAEGGGSTNVTVYDYGTDSVQWQYEFAAGNSAVSSLSPTGSVADIDGDGVLEVAVAVYGNGAEVGGSDDGIEGAGQWTIGLYDAVTGQTLGSLENRTVVGFADVDHNGVADLITRSATLGTTAAPDTGTLEVWTLDDQRAPELLWAVEDVAPVFQVAPTNLAISSRDFNLLPALFDVGGDDRPKLLVSLGDSDSPISTIQALNFEGADVTVAAQTEVEGGRGALLIQTGDQLLDSEHSILRSTLGRFRVYDSGLTARDTLVLSGHTSDVLAVKLRAGDALQTIHRAATGELVALDPTDAGPLQAPTELWSQETNGGTFIAFDRDGDGISEVVYSSTADDGSFYMEMLDADGQSIWRQTLQDGLIPAYSLSFGQFGGQGDNIDIAAIGYLTGAVPQVWTFDGTDGEIMSTRTVNRADVGSFPNVELLVSEDRTGDGLNELIAMHYTAFELLDGSDVSVRIGDAHRFPPGNFRPQNTALLQDGDNLGIFIKPLSNSAIVAESTGDIRWTQTLPTSLNSYVSLGVGVADANGDGTSDVAVPGLLGDVTVYNGADGAVLYRVCLDGGLLRFLDEPATLDNCVPIAPVSSISTGDIDGDGELEFVMGSAGGFLYALNVADGTSSWILNLGGRASFPALVDVDGDGELEVVTTTSRSELVVVDHAEITPTAEVRDVSIDDGNNILNPDLDIAQTARTDALGAAWDAVDRADSYEVQLLTQNDTQIVDRTNVGNVTEFVFTGLALTPGTTYKVVVSALSDTLGAAPPTTSNGVTVVGGPPTIVNLRALPNPLTLGVDSTTRVTGLIQADGATLLTEASIRILDESDTVLAERNFTPGVTNFNLTFVWNATDENNAPVGSGEYRAVVTARDAIGAEVTDSVSITVREAGDPLIEDLVADPDTFNPGAGQTTTLSATVTADGALNLAEVALTIRDSADTTVFEEIYAPGTASFSLRTIWDGNDLTDALVAEGEYIAQLVATDSLDRSTTASVTISVVPPGAPVIEGFVAEPDTIDPAAGQTTALSAQITGTVELEEVVLTIRDADNGTVFERTYDPQADSFSLTETWDGRSEGNLVAPGEYEATLSTTDAFDNTTTATATITIVPPGAARIDDFSADPDTFDPGMGMVSALSATIVAGNAEALESVALEIQADNGTVVFEQSFEPNADVFALQTTWDGADSQGAIVPDGSYRATLMATNALGSMAEDTLILTVVSSPDPNPEPNPDPNPAPNPEPTPNPDANPDTGEVKGGSNCTCTTPSAPASTPGSALWLAALALGGFLLRRR